MGPLLCRLKYNVLCGMQVGQGRDFLLPSALRRPRHEGWIRLNCHPAARQAVELALLILAIRLKQQVLQARETSRASSSNSFILMGENL